MNRRTFLKAALTIGLSMPVAKSIARIASKRRYPADPVTAYALAVDQGKIVACRWVKLACARHLQDLNDPRFWWDEEAAVFAINFFPLMRLWEGSFSGEPFELLPWQEFVVGSVFGWKWRSGDRAGYRRFKYAYVEIPRKNAKTTLAAGVAAYMLLADGEAGAQVYFVSTKEDQSKIGWNCLRKIAKRSPGFDDRLRARVKEIEYAATDSICRPLGSDSDTLDGLNPSCAILDEFHAWKDHALREVIVEGMGARLEPLVFQITTAGVNSAGPCAEERAHVCNILQSPDSYGNAAPDYFGIIYTVDHEDEVETPIGWLKSNPSLDRAIRRDELESKVREMRLQPSKRNGILNKRFNVWTTLAETWLDPEQFRACRATRPDDRPTRLNMADLVEELRGKPCYGGLDMSEKIDLTSLALWFPDSGTTLEYYWLPEGTMERHEREARIPYAQWAAEGWLTVTEGRAVDFNLVRDQIVALSKIFTVRELAFDPWKATETATNLTSRGIQMVECRQGYPTLSEPSHELEKLIVTGDLRHAGNPITEWCVCNTSIKSDENGNIRPVKPDRKKTHLKIDGVVALIMALSRSVKAEIVRPSVYETRGLRRL